MIIALSSRVRMSSRAWRASSPDSPCPANSSVISVCSRSTAPANRM
ncbi:hypothetical protein QP028_04950 [Corynebacterium suedekumii]|nr:hypothetical protein QP028_04950 [Corynebacterium suedekumii]